MKETPSLRITLLRNLPPDTFEKECVAEVAATTGRSNSGFPCRKQLIFDLESLLDVHKQGIISELTGPEWINVILIPELLLHELDIANKKALRDLEIKLCEEDMQTSNRVRDLLGFLFSKREENWLRFQRKGVEEDKNFLRELELDSSGVDKRRYVSWALYIKQHSKEDVLLVTSNPKLQRCAKTKNVPTVSLHSFFSDVA